MNEHDKQVSGIEATANPAPSTVRRRLVKGAMLATPAVMTLMSGRLASAASCTPVSGDDTGILCQSNILSMDPAKTQE